jgi:hypothetical protein
MEVGTRVDGDDGSRDQTRKASASHSAGPARHSQPRPGVRHSLGGGTLAQVASTTTETLKGCSVNAYVSGSLPNEVANAAPVTPLLPSYRR